MKAIAHGTLLADQIPDSPTFGMTISVLLHAGRPKDAVAMIELLQKDASRCGSVTGAAIATSLRASAYSRGGDLTALEALSRRALELSLEGGWQTGVALAVSLLVTALTRQGDLNEAEQTLQGRGLIDKLPETVSFFDWLLLARGELRIAQHRTQEGLDDLLEIGRRERLSGWEEGLLWRVRAAPVLAARGERDHGRRLAEEELEMARHRGTPGHLGTALRALGLTLQGTAGIEHLRDAAALLAKSGWRLEHARAFGDLGAALRRTNHRADAREPLRAALEIAHRCGALPLEQTIRTELTATGARPRNAMLTGAESLTTSERRIADLAARGLTNPQIAQTLFVTRKTVELHLSTAYRKLGIQSRQHLPEALA
jgi:ATP/maltotriose-dependent transcriptional regulator MalT